MDEKILKLSPHRDLQCYFLLPSAIGAISQASESGFVLSGKWRQQFDWAVVEWNRDNTFDHPAFRYLPDGDLSQLVLSYEEERSACIPFESNLVPVVAWDKLRIWTNDCDGPTPKPPYTVTLNDPAIRVPVEGSYTQASVTMTLVASPGIGKRAGIACLEEHHYYTVGATDSLAQIAIGIANDVNALSSRFSAISNGPQLTLTCAANDVSLLGANGNRLTVYGFAEGGAAIWQAQTMAFSGGTFPSRYKVTIDFAALRQSGIPTDQVRKLRWTWAADLQSEVFEQTEFQVSISNWVVTGNGRTYSVAGPGSRRIEDTDASVRYIGNWASELGNYSASRIHLTSQPGDSLQITYTEGAEHDLYIGTRRLFSAAITSVSVDGGEPALFDLSLAGEDVLVRQNLGKFAAGSHTVVITHSGTAGRSLYFDFLEIVYAAEQLPSFPVLPKVSLSTDWDTYHSQSLPAERTAWMINKLGFGGRVNHYAGALWFYEIVRTGTVYSSVTLNFTAQKASNPLVILNIEAPNDADATPTKIQHVVLPDDTTENVVQAIAAIINQGTNLLWASANGTELQLTARSMGTSGDGIRCELDAQSRGFSLTPQTGLTAGGVDGLGYDLDSDDPVANTLAATADYWQTDLNAQPRLNRAARDWHRAYYAALRRNGTDVTTSFSTELLNVDPSPRAGMAQRYADGSAVLLNTPAIQTNFSPTALAYWSQVYTDMASLQAQAGLTPYLQFGEVQWWYFAKAVQSGTSSMPFYDAYTRSTFQNKYGRDMQIITGQNANPADYPNEVEFLPSLIGSYTAGIRAAVSNQFPNCRWEVLFPVDTNDTNLNREINFAAEDWTPAHIQCLKTENFTYTGSFLLDKTYESVTTALSKGFPPSQASHLVGISDATSPWLKETNFARAANLESVTLFALDQYCLIGYTGPFEANTGRTLRQG